MWSIGCWEDKKLCGSGVTFCCNAGWSCTLLKGTEIIYTSKEVHLSESGRKIQTSIWVFPKLSIPIWLVWGFHSHWLAVVSKALLAAAILFTTLFPVFLLSLCMSGFNHRELLNKPAFPSSPCPATRCCGSSERLCSHTSPPRSLPAQNGAVTLPCTPIGDLLVSFPLTVFIQYGVRPR